MSVRRLIPVFVFLSVLGGALVATSRPAEAGNYIVYLHGRSMNGWPNNALLGAPAGWFHVPMSYDGSASLGDSSTRTSITNTISSFCGSGNQCIVVCYSAGCARMFDAYKLLKDQGRYPGGILWSQAAASAAGGSELATFVTRWWVRWIVKLFKSDAAIDHDIQPNVMRAGAYAAIQNQATTPVYHQAGGQNICLSFRILFIKVKLCSNTFFPGNHGDGLVAVHSAGGYSDTASHANTNDGGPKYILRAYEQTPLYPADHFSILSPLVSAASLRLAVGKNVTCQPMPGVNLSMPDASIIYDDADGAFTEESSPLALLAMCGNNVWNGAPALYATCYSAAGCCSSFSDGSAGGCSCGETLCQQAKVAYRSYYTSADCTGTEYADTSYVSYNGLGMVGESTSNVTVRSARTGRDGRCQVLVHLTSWGNGTCYELTPTSKVIGVARRVYRPAGAPPPPAGTAGHMVVSSQDYPNTLCP